MVRASSPVPSYEGRKIINSTWNCDAMALRARLHSDRLLLKVTKSPTPAEFARR
ncbi:MAG: hypothetical protein SAL70_38905 [Scytonema sp. PMC 1070.18]|nr:hypothetical protein [Scytonema sp. PMC 1070.18]